MMYWWALTSESRCSVLAILSINTYLAIVSEAVRVRPRFGTMRRDYMRLPDSDVQLYKYIRVTHRCSLVDARAHSYVGGVTSPHHQSKVRADAHTVLTLPVV